MTATSPAHEKPRQLQLGAGRGSVRRFVHRVAALSEATIHSLSVIPSALAASAHLRLARDTPRMVRLSALPPRDFLSPPCLSGDGGAPVRFRAADTFWRLVPSTAASAVSDSDQSAVFQSIMFSGFGGSKNVGGVLSAVVADNLRAEGNEGLPAGSHNRRRNRLVELAGARGKGVREASGNRRVVDSDGISRALDAIVIEDLEVASDRREREAGGLAEFVLGGGQADVGQLFGHVRFGWLTRSFCHGFATNAIEILRPMQKSFEPRVSSVNKEI